MRSRNVSSRMSLRTPKKNRVEYLAQRADECVAALLTHSRRPGRGNGHPGRRGNDYPSTSVLAFPSTVGTRQTILYKYIGTVAGRQPLWYKIVR